MTLFDMSGKVAVITGSTRGIGRAIAERMAEHGAKVVISSRKQDVCDQVTGEINDKFGKGTAISIAANISSKENLQNLVDESNRAFGKIDVLVCNAASNPYYGPLAGISDDQFRKILNNNIVVNEWLISMVVPQMIARRDGSIIIVSSIGGLKGSTILGAHAISKAADMQLARNAKGVAARPGDERSLHRGIHEIPHQRPRVVALARALAHEHDEHILLRIDPEERPGNAAPEILADAAGEGRNARLRTHGEA